MMGYTLLFAVVMIATAFLAGLAGKSHPNTQMGLVLITIGSFVVAFTEFGAWASYAQAKDGDLDAWVAWLLTVIVSILAGFFSYAMGWGLGLQQLDVASGQKWIRRRIPRPPPNHPKQEWRWPR